MAVVMAVTGDVSSECRSLKLSAYTLLQMNMEAEPSPSKDFYPRDSAFFAIEPLSLGKTNDSPTIIWFGVEAFHLSTWTGMSGQGYVGCNSVPGRTIAGLYSVVISQFQA